ncbi:amino acid ABC transporter substrate-binding protein [Ruminococcus sp.]|uniref:amino acid ABC transporter substrate-binding protein n=1 Tax=Ruminococcus sp. TaxID=41978 RepID=UPI001AFFD984|nr:amino acid ABC transporter substrate-binding protein [Ruminococcus sp.]MBO5559539.1 amino acid ABC transporter substrate-binding protein [Ruminococcus sp.]
MVLKRVMAAVLGMAVVAAAFSGCGAKGEKGEKKSADGKKTFTVGFDAEFPPYGFKDDNGEYVGFDLSLAEEVCKRNDWELVKQPIDWDSKDMELSSGSIDCIWNGFTINGREDSYTWSTPYIDNSQVVVVKADGGISDLKGLAGKVVIVQADSSALHALDGEDASDENKALAATFADLQQVGDYNTAFLNLESGAADAICMDYGVAAYEVSSRGDAYVILDENVSTERYGVGFLKGNTELRDKVQDTLLKMYEDGTFEKIADEWADRGIDKASLCFDPADKAE